ncbi:PAS domain S-box protein [Natronobeatus ordinarius]|uniref:PAS domain S-box protein n=1 Tax=Natronobeatus ordinarius TaxID=2963433 RepID=UPI0020CCD135|nr:PAS domain S-box protein [Natronobeatus ordinarius]
MATSNHADGDLEARVRQQEVVAELGKRALESRDLDEFMFETTEAVRETLGADYCNILELLPGGEELRLVQGVGWDGGVVGSATVPTGPDSQAGQTLLTEAPVVVEDLENESRVSGLDVLVEHDVTSGVNVVVGSIEEPWGVFGVHTTDQRTFTEADVTFVQSVANLLASAIENEAKNRRLREERALRDRIVETSPVGILHLDADGAVVSANERATEILRRDRETIEAMSNDDPGWGFVDESGAPLPDELVPSKRVVENGERALGFRMGVADPDGGRVWLSVNAGPLRSADGEVTGVILAFKDVTDQKRTEEQLRAERALKDRILETSPVGITLIDADGMNVFANDRAEAILGRSLEELRTYVHDDDRWNIVDESGEALSGAELPFSIVQETGEPVYDEVIGIDHPDGTRVWITAHCAPLYDAEGRFDGAVYALKDITEEKRLERRLETTLERVTDAFNAFDTDWNVTYINDRARELLDAEDRDLIGESVWEAFPSAVGSRFEEEYRRAMATQESVTFEAYSPVADGWLEVSAYPSETGLSVYFRDVSERKERERQLERFERMVETVNDGVYATDGEGTIVFVNDAFVSMSRHTRAELLGSHGSRFFGDRFVDTDEAEWRQLVDGELDAVEFETEIDGPDGETRTVQNQFVPLELGAETGRVGVTRDVTERKERERRLSKYETIVETVDDGIYTVDAEGRFTMVNRAYTELTGYSREELLGAHGSLVADEAVMERARQLAAEPDETKLEADLETADGERVPTEATITSHVDEASGERRRIGVVRDISERRARQRRLEESERRYRTLVDHFPNGAVGLFDEDLQYTLVGGELLDELNMTSDDVIGTSIHDRYSEDVIAEIEPKFRAALEGEENAFEIALAGRELLVHTVPVRDEQSAVFAGMVMVQDVTERKEYQRKLEESNERLEQFAYAASHDLQEPLRMVSSYLTLIERRYADELDSDGREFIEFAVDGADRMQEMIDGLLAYSRVDTRGDPLEPVDLEDVVEDVLTDLGMKVDECDAVVDVDALPHVHGDPGQLRQLFQNVLDNAITYAGDDPPRVTVFAEERGSEWVVSVEDEGIGIDPDQTDRIFEVFNRLHSVEEYEGAGIGLALCERIVERHGGRIWVDSEPGVGSTVSFTLPAIPTDHV